MPIAHEISSQLQGSSWIRKMFEEGMALKKEHGADKVFDFSLGNPVMEPPEQFRKELIKYVSSPELGKHRYMHNAGFEATRQAVAKRLGKQEGKPLTSSHLIMTCGAGGALNVTLKTLLNRGENVVIFAPYFVEYLFYIGNHGGQTKVVQTASDFDIDLEKLARGITKKTRAVIFNSPNNPTGKVYSEKTMHGLGKLLRAKQKEFGTTIYLISDEPYRELLFDGLTYPGTFSHYANSIIVGSHSKDLSLAGERIGYIAVNPKAKDTAILIGGMTFCNRTLGFVNAPAIMQQVASRVQGVKIDVTQYEQKRNMLCKGLKKIGYDLETPGGAFYLFPRSPIADETKFVRALAREALILTVPGRGFGRKGFFRIAYCVEEATIEQALPGFEKVFRRVTGS